MSFHLEICCFNYQSAIAAAEAGANRVELCADPGAGGTTPDFGTIKLVRHKISVALYPIIRPRGGDFLYLEDELDIMAEDVRVCRNIGCDGVVLGMLTTDGSVDKEKCCRLVEIAYPMGVTFHRAFDRSADPFKALEDIIDTGCERILTSGMQPSAIEGALLIRELIIRSANRIEIMPGSGVRSDNILGLAKETGAKEFHSSARLNKKSKMNYSNLSMQEELSMVSADPVEIESMKAKLAGFFEARQ